MTLIAVVGCLIAIIEGLEMWATHHAAKRSENGPA